MVIHKIISFGNSNGVSIPAAFLRKMGVQQGSYVSLALLEHGIIIIAPLERQALLSQVGFINSKLSNENTNRNVRSSEGRTVPLVQHDNKPPTTQPPGIPPGTVRSADTSEG